MKVNKDRKNKDRILRMLKRYNSNLINLSCTGLNRTI